MWTRMALLETEWTESAWYSTYSIPICTNAATRFESHPCTKNDIPLGNPENGDISSLVQSLSCLESLC